MDLRDFIGKVISKKGGYKLSDFAGGGLMGNIGQAAKAALPGFIDPNDHGLKGIRFPYEETEGPAYRVKTASTGFDDSFQPIPPVTPPKQGNALPADFEPIAPVENYQGPLHRETTRRYLAPEKIYGSDAPPAEPDQPSVLDAVKSAYPKFMAEANAAPGKALQDMADYEQVNPIGSALSFTGNVVAGKAARGFKQAEELGRVFGGAVDKLPRFEISDATSKIGELPKFFQGKKLSEVLDHPELFKQYPEFADVEIQKMLPTLENADKAGQFTKVNGKPVIRIRADATPSEARSSLLHEIQHMIQDKEGFTQGTHAESPGYGRNLGEMEARAVQGRMNLSPAALEASPLKDFLAQMERMRS